MASDLEAWDSWSGPPCAEEGLGKDRVTRSIILKGIIWLFQSDIL